MEHSHLFLVVGLLAAGAVARADACRPLRFVATGTCAPTTLISVGGGGGFSRARLDASHGVLALECNSSDLASRLVNECPATGMPPVPPPNCCSAVLDTVDNPDGRCLCNVHDDSGFEISYLGIDSVWKFYRACGGRKQEIPKDTTSCAHAPAASPPPPPPSSPPPPPPRRPPPSSPPPRRPAGLPGAQLAGFVIGVVAGSALVISTVIGLVRAFFFNKLPAAEVTNVSSEAASAPAAIPQTVAMHVPRVTLPRIEMAELSPAPPAVRG